MSISVERARSLFDIHQKWAEGIARAAKRKLPDGIGAEDLKQEAYKALWVQCQRYDPSLNANFEAFAYQAVHGACFMAGRRRAYKETQHSELPMRLVGGERPDAALLKQDAQRQSFGREADAIAREIHHHEEMAEAAARGALAHKLQVGQLLTKARATFKAQGAFARWAKAEFDWSLRHCKRHIQLAQHAGEVMQLDGLGISMRAALALIRDTRVPHPERWFVIGVLEAAPAQGVEAAALLNVAKDWRIKKCA